MKIVELDEVAETEIAAVAGELAETQNSNRERRLMVRVDAKRALVGAGARILFYPTLLYNVFRNKINQAEFRWWDQIDQVNFCTLYHFTFSFFHFNVLAVYFTF